MNTDSPNSRLSLRAIGGWFLAASVLVVVSAGYVGARLERLSRAFTPPVTVDESGLLRPHAEFAPADRLGLPQDGPIRIVDAAERADPGVRRWVAAGGDEAAVPKELILAGAPRFPRLVLDEDMAIVESPLRQLNQGRAPSGPGESDDPSDAGESFLLGARLLAFEGRPVASVADYEAMYSTFRDTILIRYTLLPAGAAAGAAPIEFIVWKADWTRAAVIFLSGLAFAALGLAVIYLQPGTYSARGFLVFCVVLGVFSMIRSIPSTYRIEPERWVFSTLMAALPTACGIFLVTFSPWRLVFLRLRPVMTVLIAWGAGLWLTNQATHPGQSYFGGGPAFLLWAVTMLGFVLTPLPADYAIRWMGVPLGSMDRQRSHTIRLAIVVAFLPLAAQTIYYEITKNSGWVWVDLCTLLFPAIVAFAVLRRGLLIIDEIVLHGIVLLMLSAVVGLGYSGVLAISSQLAPHLAFLNSGMFNGFLLGVLTFSAGGVQITSRRWVERRLNRVPAEFESLLGGAEDQTLTIIDPLPYCERLVRSIGPATGGAAVAVYLCTPDRIGHWWMAARTGPPRPGPSSRAIGPALNFAATEKAMIARDALLDELSHSGQRREFDAAFREMGAALLFPLLYGSEVWGVLAVGDRPDLKPFRASEQMALKRMMEQAALRMREASRRMILQGHNRRIARPRIAQIYPECPPRIGPYRIDRVLGRGGMALVYRGWRDGRPYALKVPNLTVQGDAKMMRRFAHEARTLLRLRHPHVITVDEVGDEGGEPWIAMEYLPMGTLADHLKKEGGLREDLARTLTSQVALGLAAAQAENVIHRDIKPQNILLVSADTVKVTDFGLAKVGDMTTLTTISKLMGTPGYIAPEIWENRGADWWADQYALGVTLYEMLAGERPFRADSVVGLMKAHLFMTPQDLRDRGVEVSAGTAATVLRMLAKRPEERFSSYAELVAALGVGAGAVVREDDER